jgi:tRNA dimethylallyltransferase
MAPLVVIVGPTASGKTALAIELAEQFGGEIICADSRTIYKGMDIGTAKPTATEQARVPHHGLDLVEPNERFNVADFKTYAEQKIAEIRERGRIPFLVGGTGLYVDAIIYDYQFGPRADDTLRQQLEDMSLADLWKYCNNNNILLPENKQNKRYVIRAIEKHGSLSTRRTEPIAHTIIVGITTEKDVLRQRITQRAEQLFDDGMIEEATRIGEQYGWESEAMTGNIYRLVHEYLDGHWSDAELRERFVYADWQLAKRQLTWLKRSPHITWLPLQEAQKYIASRLAPEH